MMNRSDRVLALFHERPRWLVAELCAKTGYAVSTVHGALSELSEQVTSVESAIPRHGSGRRVRIYSLAGQGRHAARYGIPQEPKL